MKRYLLPFFLALLLAGCAAQAAVHPSTQTPFPTYTPGLAPFGPSITQKNLQGFPLTLRGVFREGENLRASFCYTLPTEDDWQLGHRVEDVTLFTGGVEYPQTGGGLISTDGNQQGTRRCAYVLFPVPKWQALAEVKITVRRLVTSPKEVPDCDLAQQKLNRKHIPITFWCSEGDHTWSFQIGTKPDNMTEQQARDLIFFEGIVDYVSGPWIFTSGLFSSSAE